MLTRLALLPQLDGFVSSPSSLLDAVRGLLQLPAVGELCTWADRAVSAPACCPQ